MPDNQCLNCNAQCLCARRSQQCSCCGASCGSLQCCRRGDQCKCCDRADVVVSSCCRRDASYKCCKTTDVTASSCCKN